MLCIWKAISEVKTTEEKMDVDEKYTLSKIEKERRRNRDLKHETNGKRRMKVRQYQTSATDRKTALSLSALSVSIYLLDSAVAGNPLYRPSID